MPDRFDSREEVVFDDEAYEEGRRVRREHGLPDRNPHSWSGARWRFESWGAGWADEDMVIASEKESSRDSGGTSND